MKIEVRKAKTEELATVRKIGESANLLPATIIPQALVDNITEDMTMCAFVNGQAATSFAAWPYSMRINGASVPVACVTLVGTNPVYRRLGCLRKVITSHLATLKEEGIRPFAVLSASQAAIYQRYGYGIVSTRHSYRVEPRHLRFQWPYPLESGGTIHEVGGAERQVLEDLYGRFIQDRTGYLERTPFIWENGSMLDPPQGAISTKLLYEEDGQPQGFVIFNSESAFFPSGQMGHRITIRDFVWLTPNAYHNLIDFFTRLDLAQEVVWRSVPEDDPLPHLLMEPKTLHLSAGDGILARVVDVPTAIQARKYDVDGEARFQIVDPLCPWNEGSWCVTVNHGKAVVTKSDQVPELKIPVDTLSMLLFGQISVSQALNMGRIACDGQVNLIQLDQLFKTKFKAFCSDVF